MHPCPVCGDSFKDANDLMLHYQSEEHREKVRNLGVNTNVLAGAIGQETTEEELSDEVIMRSISESDAFQAALAGGVE